MKNRVKSTGTSTGMWEILDLLGRWLLVGIPLSWGIYEVVLKTLAIFVR